MKTITQVPEAPVQEDWAWASNTIVATDGTEQRVQLLPSPKRSFSFNYIFTTAADMRAVMSIGLAFGQAFQLPLYQHGARFTADPAAGAGSISFNAARTELRAGMTAYVFDDNGGECVTINAVLSDHATLTGVLSRGYVRGSVAPIAAVMIGNNATAGRYNPNNAGTATFVFQDTGFLTPFANPFLTAALTMFNGLPVLERNGIGTQFSSSFDTGIQPIDYGGVIEIRSPWKHAQIVMPRSFQCDRFQNPSDWEYWRVFADYCRGAQKPFYMPTFRGDFDIYTAPAPGGTTMTLTGRDYADNWFPIAPFKTLAIYTSGGVHYTTVTAAVVAGGNTNVTFNPPLPAGGAWALNQSISLLMKVRIADDKISCQHQPLETVLTIAIRTVDA